MKCRLALVALFLGLSTPGISVRAAGAQQNPEPRIAIDAAKSGEPISKYIYGQFIEHLGRCIYGGIWAEMLEDRKFFDPVGSQHSPWKAIGPADRVTMDRQQPFVGQHTPTIALPGGGKSGGIVQGALALRKGKQYVGRVWLAGSPTAGPVKVSLLWGDGPDQRQTIAVDKVGADYAKTPLQFTAGGDSDNGRLEIAAAGNGSLLVGTASLMPADNVQGMRADTLAVLKQLDSPVYRWPGGNFVSGYHWKDGIGDRDRRPPRKNPAWKGIEHNDFGLDEFMTFCRLVNTEPFIAVNSGLGDAKTAVEELLYANAPADKPGGELRAKNGYPQPYGVKWWSIGNEMYGGWQLGHMSQDKYIQKHNEFVEAMRAADPSIKVVAVGAVGPWSEKMMQKCADHMNLISEHLYCQEKPNDLPAHVRQIADAIRRIANAHRDYRKRFDSLKDKDIRIALDEWNYWYGPHVYGELGTKYFLKDALGIAAGLHEYARQSDIVFMANYAQTVNVIGCIKTSKTAAAFDTTGLALMLYRKHFGVVPVAVEATPPLDVAAAWTADRKALTIGIVNPTMQKLDIPLTLAGAKLSGSGQCWRIAGNDPMAHNEPGKEPPVKIEESPVRDLRNRLSAPPCSVTLYSLETLGHGQAPATASQ
jgi:alpha-N-arabinofuranosidase